MLSEQWINRIFTVMATMYGVKFTNMWIGQDLLAVKETWAIQLGGFHDRPDCIKDALEALSELHFPPTLPQFITLCRNAACRRGERLSALQYKATAADTERNRKLSQQLTCSLLRGDVDPLNCWRYPLSQKVVDELYNAKKNPLKYPKLEPIFFELLANGIADSSGKALKLWDSTIQAFVAVDRC